MAAESFSVNERAERLMGRRRTDVVAFDHPVELGYWCPACRIPPVVDGEFDERLEWSEYRGFIWCSVCNKDYPSALCVPLDGERDADRPWVNVGVDDAISVFLDSVEDATGAAIQRGAE